MNTAWCPVCGNAILNTDAVVMQCANTAPHYSEYNVYGVPQQVFPDVSIVTVEEKQETQQQAATNGKRK